MKPYSPRLLLLLGMLLALGCEGARTPLDLPGESGGGDGGQAGGGVQGSGGRGFGGMMGSGGTMSFGGAGGQGPGAGGIVNLGGNAGGNAGVNMGGQAGLGPGGSPGSGGRIIGAGGGGAMIGGGGSGGGAAGNAGGAAGNVGGAAGNAGGAAGNAGGAAGNAGGAAGNAGGAAGNTGGAAGNAGGAAGNAGGAAGNVGGAAGNAGGAAGNVGGAAGNAGGAAGGGGAVPSGGTIASGGNSGAGGAACPGPAPNEDLIDNLDDGDRYILSGKGRVGSWTDSHDASPSGTMYPDPINLFTPTDTGDVCRQFAAHVKGGGFSDWGADLWFGLGSPYDASKYTGISFWARVDAGTTSVLRIAFPDKDTFPDGGICQTNVTGPTQCFDHYGARKTLGTTWQKYTVSFKEITQDGWGLQGSSFDPSSLYEVLFQIPVNATFSIWIDDVAFTLPP